MSIPLLSFLLLLLSTNISSPSPSPSLPSACSATLYPSLCISSLSTANATTSNLSTASDIVSTSLSLSSTNLTAAKSKLQSLNDTSTDANRTLAATSCLEVVGYALARLAAAERSLNEGLMFDDVRAFASAAVSYQSGCWSGFKYLMVNDTDGQVADVLSSMIVSTNLTSNALSLATAYQRYGDNVSTWGPPQTERDGYWPTANNNGTNLESLTRVPTNLPPNATVCKNDTCQFMTVQSAIDVAPANSTNKFVIYVKESVYDEIVRVPFEKTNVVLIGDGIGKTVITGNLSVGTPGVSTYNSATVGVIGDGFMAANLSILNTAGPTQHQAVAYRSSSDRSILESVSIQSHQDTLYAHSLRQLYKNCTIYGTVDFIFGNSAAIFQNCTILIVPRQVNPEQGEQNTVTANSRSDPAQSTGFVFVNCTVNATEDYLVSYDNNTKVHRNYLGRPWKEYSRAVFIDCYLERIVRSEGWLNWDGDFALSTLYFGEFGSKGPGANVTGRVPWSSQIPSTEHLDLYSVQNFVQM